MSLRPVHCVTILVLAAALSGCAAFGQNDGDIDNWFAKGLAKGKPVSEFGVAPVSIPAPPKGAVPSSSPSEPTPVASPASAVAPVAPVLPAPVAVPALSPAQPAPEATQPASSASATADETYTLVVAPVMPGAKAVYSVVVKHHGGRDGAGETMPVSPAFVKTGGAPEMAVAWSVATCTPGQSAPARSPCAIPPGATLNWGTLDSSAAEVMVTHEDDGWHLFGRVGTLGALLVDSGPVAQQSPEPWLFAVSLPVGGGVVTVQGKNAHVVPFKDATPAK